jgi:hypothetical protein
VSLMSWAKCTGRARRVGLGNPLAVSPGKGLAVCPKSDSGQFFLRASDAIPFPVVMVDGGSEIE